MIVYVNDYGAKADGVALCTKAVQSAIDACAVGGGGEVRLSSGKYVLSTVFLKSGVRIVIGKDTEVLGSLKFSDYSPDEKADGSLYQDASHSFFHCSMFVAENCENIGISGGGIIDMRSVWDEANVRDMAHRGAKCIAFKNCRKVVIENLSIFNATDLAVHLAGCEDAEISRLNMRVHIDGITADNCNCVHITDCDVESGDDGIVFKSSYSLGRLGVCENAAVKNCRIKSCCSAIKFGTESIGGFRNIAVENVQIRDTWLAGISVVNVDGGIADGLTFRDIVMKNVGGPLFVHLGERLRCPKREKAGEVRNLLFENIRAEGPYEPWDAFAWNYESFRTGNAWQFPYIGSEEELRSHKRFTSNMCGLLGNPIKNIKMKNVSLTVPGGIKERPPRPAEDSGEYPEVFVYGETLPTRGIYFRHVRGLELSDVSVINELPDAREPFMYDDVDEAIK